MGRHEDVPELEPGRIVVRQLEQPFAAFTRGESAPIRQLLAVKPQLVRQLEVPGVAA